METISELARGWEAAHPEYRVILEPCDGRICVEVVTPWAFPPRSRMGSGIISLTTSFNPGEDDAAGRFLHFLDQCPETSERLARSN